MRKILLAFLAGLLFMFGLQQFMLNWRVPEITAVLPDGGHYQGQLLDGVLQGHGVVSWDNGASFEGSFVDGLFDGRGHYRMSNDIVYDGEFAAGEINGYGRMVFAPGHIYEGEFRRGNFAGTGTYTTESETYTGEFADDLYHGQGKLETASGTRYVGEFANGNFQGQGLFTSAAGDTYSGTFENGALVGKGSFTAQTGDRYVGDFKDWKFDGQGTYNNSKGDQYIGQFKDGDMVGTGQFVGIDGSRYRGQFQDWSYHGEGILRTADGNAYKGGFKFGMYHGGGVLSFARPLDGRAFVSGKWRAGRMVKSDDKSLLLDPEEIAEIALYNQQDLLAQHLGGVLESAEDEINLYFVGVAGDGTQAVFRREVLFVKDLFDTRFGTAGRSIALVNDRQTVRKFPLATISSLRQGLQSIASHMNPDQDILFLYLTSHGSQKHEFSLQQEGIALPDLPAKILADMLQELPIRWKVVVVSACYSGGFIPLLANDNTLVISSADADRTSFGCSDLADFSYFGEAFFKQALADEMDFSVAFEQARAIINIREVADEFTPSQPQMRAGEPILQQLARWRSGLAATP